MNKQRQKRIKTYILIISLLIIVPSGFTFWSTIQESIFMHNADRFINENFDFEATWINKEDVAYNNGKNSTIDVYLMGDIISKELEEKIAKKLPDYELEKCSLVVHQFKDKSDELAGKLTAEVKSGILEDLYERKEKLLNDKDATIDFLEQELFKLKSDTIPFTAVKKELNVQYPNVIQMSYGKTIVTNFKKQQDTIPAFFMRWKSDLTEEEIATEKASVEKWLKVRLSNPKTTVINY